MPQHARHDDEDTAELYEDTVELPATSPELPIDAQAIVEWRKEAAKDFKCGIPQTVKAVNPYSTADQAAAPAADSLPSTDQGQSEASWRSSLRGTLSVLRRWFVRRKQAVN
jgi:hypothetical protein